MPLAALAAFAASSPEQELNTRLRAEKNALRTREAELSNECERLERSIRIEKTVAELMTGERAEPPSAKPRWRLLHAYETNAPCFFDATPGNQKNRDIWLKLAPGRTYRCEADVKCENLVGTRNLKFGAYAPVAGASPNWPSANVGAGTFDWTPVAFEYAVPHGGGFMLSYGPGGGTGKVWFRNVKVYEKSDP
jgi:hypothetical protein